MWLHLVRNMSIKPSTAEKVAAMSASELLKNPMTMSDWNKRLLVFSGRFKTMAEVPATLPSETYDKARNYARIKFANILIALTVVGCIGMVISGKKAAKRGETVEKMNMDWHREYNEKAKEEAEAMAKINKS